VKCAQGGKSPARDRAVDQCIGWLSPVVGTRRIGRSGTGKQPSRPMKK
jgi:hypothetical protein